MRFITNTLDDDDASSASKLAFLFLPGGMFSAAVENTQTTTTHYVVNKSAKMCTIDAWRLHSNLENVVSSANRRVDRKVAAVMLPPLTEQAKPYPHQH